MDLAKTLNAVGKAVFVKYYYVFMNMPSADCVEMFTENYTQKSKISRTSHAKMIFREGKQKEALIIILDSQKTDPKTKEKALQIYAKEGRKKRFGIL